MIIERLEMLNWGPYKGRHALTFSGPSGERKIEHVRAMNGHGKTNVLNALKIGLHGAAAMKFIDDDRPLYARDRQHLNDFLRRKVTHGTVVGEGPHVEISITLSELTSAGRREITITRRWWIDGEDSVESELAVLVNGQPFVAEGRDSDDQAEQFIGGIIPAEIVQFFFFDGERIQSLADSELTAGAGNALAQALDDLLGFTTLDMLKGDLNHLRAELGKRQTQNKEAVASAARIAGNIRQIEAEVSAKQESIYSAEAELEQVKRVIEDLRRQLPGGADSASFESDGRLKLVDRIQGLKDNESKVRNAAGEAIGKDLSLAYADDLAARTLERIEAELRLREWKARSEETAPEAERIANDLLGPDAPPPTPPLTKSQADFLTERLHSIVSSLASPPEDAPADELFGGMSVDQLARARTVLSHRRKESLGTLVHDLRDIDGFRQQIQYLKDQIDAIEDKRERQRLQDELNEALVRSGGVTERLNELNRELADLKEDKAKEERVLAEAESVSTGDLETDRKLEVTRALVDVVDEFREQMRRTRVRELAEKIQEMLNQLAHKGVDQFDRCEIDEKSFALKIFDSQNRQVYGPSAGEKEIIALSMIWALGTISKRRLPLVIDTPLGRLDQDHRKAVIERFLPFAAEQVIVLSQATEITDEYRAVLAEHLASEQQIVWHDSTHGSEISPLPPLSQVNA